MSFAQAHVVYVVDDDQDILEAVSAGLRCRGMRVEEFSAAQSFLDFYDGHLPAVLVLDVEMPGMTGLALQSELGMRGYDLPILFVSASTDARHREQALAAGAVGFLVKPILPDELMAYVRAAFDQPVATSRQV